MLIGALNVAYHVRIKLGGRVVGKSLLPFGADIQAKPLLLTIGSRMDEAWQILHHFRSIDNPLMVRSRLFRYIFFIYVILHFTEYDREASSRGQIV